jgi:hypothetical protein
MAAEHAFDDVRAALQHLLDQLDWLPIAGAVPDPALPDVPYITYTGVLVLPGLGPLPCYTLNTGEQVFDLEALQRLCGGAAGDIP